MAERTFESRRIHMEQRYKDEILFDGGYRDAIISMAIDERLAIPIREEEEFHDRLYRSLQSKKKFQDFLGREINPTSYRQRINSLRVRGLNTILREEALYYLALYGKSILMHDFRGQGLLDFEKLYDTDIFRKVNGPSIGICSADYDFANEHKGIILGSISKETEGSIPDYIRNYDELFHWNYSDTRDWCVDYGLDLEDKAIELLRNGKEVEATKMLEESRRMAGFSQHKTDMMHYYLLDSTKKWRYIFENIINNGAEVKTNIKPYFTMPRSIRVNETGIVHFLLDKLYLPRLKSISDAADFMVKYHNELSEIKRLLNKWKNEVLVHDDPSRLIRDKINKITKSIARAKRAALICGCLSIPLSLIPTPATIVVGALLGAGSIGVSKHVDHKYRWLVFTSPGICVK